MNTIELPVSHGEAFDKLSILEIKLQYINDDRKNDVQKEYNILYDKLKNLFNTNIKFHYRILKDINENIWIKQDIFRKSTDENEKNKLCNEIIDENDRRFHVKAKLNRLFNSSLMEQKGYERSKCFYLGHLGLGDHLTQLPIIRYLSTIYDKVIVACLEKNIENCKLFYMDDPTIQFYVVKSMENICPYNKFPFEDFQKITNGYDVYLTGQHQFDKEINDIIIKDIPFSFFDDCNIEYSVFGITFISSYIDSKNLYECVKGVSYCFLHNTSSIGNVFPVEFAEKQFGISRETTLILNTNENIYPPDHKWYELAQKFIGVRIPFYKDTIENADYILLSDSSIYCLSLHLNLKTENAFVLTQKDDYSYFYNEKYCKNSKVNISKIKCIFSLNSYINNNNNSLDIKYITTDLEEKEVSIELNETNKINKFCVELNDILGREKKFYFNIKYLLENN